MMNKNRLPSFFLAKCDYADNFKMALMFAMTDQMTKLYYKLFNKAHTHARTRAHTHTHQGMIDPTETKSRQIFSRMFVTAIK